ncbi:MAG: Ku protein [Halomonadaceae bacterium]|nr:Ku protein [Halomonadaceae bacterium]
MPDLRQSRRKAKSKTEAKPKTETDSKDNTEQAQPKEKKRFHTSGPRPLWSGTITFGLVSLPVNLYPANRPKPVSLRMVDREGTPLARRYLCDKEDRVLDYDDLIRGYEVEKEKFVVVEDQELDSLAPEQSQEIDLKRFVDLNEIDPIYFQRAYFMTPDKGVIKAYRLLAQSMQESKRAGIATFVMRGKEYLVAIIAEKGILRAETLRFADEVRTLDEIDLPQASQPDAQRIETMLQAITALSENHLERESLRDLHSQRLIARAEEKLSRGEDVIALEEVDEADSAPEQGGEVIDLMQVLKQSLAEGRPPELDAQPDSHSTTQAKSSKQNTKHDSTDLGQLSRAELYARAQKLKLPGRSGMTKAQLVEALANA